MHPTVSEQLRSVRLVVEQSMSNQDPDGNRANGALMRLRKLEDTWQEVIPFLRWDNSALRNLLRAHGHRASTELQRRITEIAVAEDSHCRFDELHAINKELRHALSELVSETYAEGLDNEPSDASTDYWEYMNARLTRHPSRPSAWRPS